ncbi:MAG: 2OG-Fe(II) oxygenase [Rhodospirillaceae bacterium]|nr:2OG-Fe(II) oxygenase [Rhodospirillaceae bacterium]MBT5674990.1 2OG-Fe(II) oxygenase [Rhodospirillaceae bacterium]MBT5780188.1 2OG-Fe(II) oxygenase [Rhodospirillaceae bacterium]MBT7292156.1 2OG-Fe(II) oxygenase [Rhodospirillaceae bacterium]
MERLLDLDRYPLHDLSRAPGRALVAHCRELLEADGMFSLAGFVRPTAIARCLDEFEPLWAGEAFTHQRDHNIYFDDNVAGLATDHAALKRFQTVNHTLCADQIPASLPCRIYEWPPLAAFLAAVMEMPCLYPMADPLARVNVMAYRAGEALNWHFDRSEFTTTLLLQAPETGGAFEYCSDLRSPEGENYDGVGRFLADPSATARGLSLAAGSLNIFKGKYAAHRVTPVAGAKTRIIAVFSYYERPGRCFSATERREFYGRSQAIVLDSNG